VNGRNTTALIAAHRGRLAEAEAGLREVVAIHRRLLAPNHDRTSNALRNLGLVIAARGRVAEGLAVLDSAIAGVRAGAHGPNQAEAYMVAQRVPLLLQLGRADEANAAAQEAWRTLEAMSSPGDILRADAIFWRGMVAFTQRDTSTAGLFEQAAAVLATQYDADHPVLARARCALGAARVRDGSAADATVFEQACTTHARWGLADPLVVAWGRTAFGQSR
jgi:tetratricopeptide (TPR) repeat protein